MSLRTLLRDFAAPIRAPQYVPVGVADPQSLVVVLLKNGSYVLDVTRNNVVLAMKPLVLGIMLDAEGRERYGDGSSLEFRLRDGEALLGSIALMPEMDSACGDFVVRAFRPVKSRNNCLGAGWRGAYELRERVKAWRQQRRNPANVQMAPRDLHALFVFYSCPRPVVLVSVEHAGRASVFPMDLIGPTASPLFSLALRTTNAAVELMNASGRFALANISLAYKDIAYELGARRALPSERADLPFRAAPSASFRLPVPHDALRIREVHVEQSLVVGSHCWFMTSVVTDTGLPEARAAGSQFSHLHGLCHLRLRQLGKLPEAAE